MAESLGDIEEAVGNFIRLARQTWLARPDSPPLLDVAHRLVDDDDVVDAAIGVSLKLGAALYGVPVFPRDVADRRILSDDQKAIIDALRNRLVAGLLDGRFVAYALKPNDAAQGKPFAVPAGRWSILAPDFERSAATYEGQTVAVGITVEVAEKRLGAARTSRRTSPNELRQWFHGHKIEWDARGQIPPIAETEKAAFNRFGGRVTRGMVRAFRNEYIPEWSCKPGPRNSAK